MDFANSSPCSWPRSSAKVNASYRSAPDEEILENDTLLFVGDVSSAHHLAQLEGLQLFKEEHQQFMANELVEVVLSPQ